MASTPPLRPATHYPAITGQVIAWLREQAGMLQGEMAQRLGISHPVWSRIERGELPLKLSTIAAAATLLGTTPGHIVELADEARRDAERRGVRVLDEKPMSPLVAGAIVVGAVALAALISDLMSRRGRRRP